MTIDTVTRPAFRYHGAKFRLAPWVISHMPPHHKYVEPYGGAAGVLLQKPRVYAEVYNDLDGELVNFFKVVRDPATRAQLIEACALTPYARAEFEQAYQESTDPIERARCLAVRAGMGFSSAGANRSTTGFRIDTDRAYGTAMANWARYPDGLAQVGARFTGVLIENRPAIEVMRQHDGPGTLHFVDPPYLHSTRHFRERATNYRHELSDDQHLELLGQLSQLTGMVMLCGYPSDLYDQQLTGWMRVETTASISGNRGTRTAREVMWLNPACAMASRRMPDLFERSAA